MLGEYVVKVSDYFSFSGQHHICRELSKSHSSTGMRLGIRGCIVVSQTNYGGFRVGGVQVKS